MEFPGENVLVLTREAFYGMMRAQLHAQLGPVVRITDCELTYGGLECKIKFTTDAEREPVVRRPRVEPAPTMPVPPVRADEDIPF